MGLVAIETLFAGVVATFLVVAGVVLQDNSIMRQQLFLPNYAEPPTEKKIEIDEKEVNMLYRQTKAQMAEDKDRNDFLYSNPTNPAGGVLEVLEKYGKVELPPALQTLEKLTFRHTMKIQAADCYGLYLQDTLLQGKGEYDAMRATIQEKKDLLTQLRAKSTSQEDPDSTLLKMAEKAPLGEEEIKKKIAEHLAKTTESEQTILRLKKEIQDLEQRIQETRNLPPRSETPVPETPNAGALVDPNTPGASTLPPPSGEEERTRLYEEKKQREAELFQVETDKKREEKANKLFQIEIKKVNEKQVATQKDILARIPTLEAEIATLEQNQKLFEEEFPDIVQSSEEEVLLLPHEIFFKKLHETLPGGLFAQKISYALLFRTYVQVLLYNGCREAEPNFVSKLQSKLRKETPNVPDLHTITTVMILNDIMYEVRPTAFIQDLEPILLNYGCRIPTEEEKQKMRKTYQDALRRENILEDFFFASRSFTLQNNQVVALSKSKNKVKNAAKGMAQNVQKRVQRRLGKRKGADATMLGGRETEDPQFTKNAYAAFEVFFQGLDLTLLYTMYVYGTFPAIFRAKLLPNEWEKDKVLTEEARKYQYAVDMIRSTVDKLDVITMNWITQSGGEDQGSDPSQRPLEITMAENNEQRPLEITMAENNEPCDVCKELQSVQDILRRIPALDSVSIPTAPCNEESHQEVNKKIQRLLDQLDKIDPNIMNINIEELMSKPDTQSQEELRKAREDLENIKLQLEEARKGKEEAEKQANVERIKARNAVEAKATLAGANAEVQMQIEEEKKRAEIAEAKVRDAEAKLATAEEAIQKAETAEARAMEAEAILRDAEEKVQAGEVAATEVAKLQEAIAKASAEMEVANKEAQEAREDAVAKAAEVEVANREAREAREEAVAKAAEVEEAKKEAEEARKQAQVETIKARNAVEAKAELAGVNADVQMQVEEEKKRAEIAEAKVREAEAKLAEVNADVQMQVEEEKKRAEMAEAKVREAEAKLAEVNADVQMQVEEEKKRAEMAEAKVREAEAKLTEVNAGVQMQVEEEKKRAEIAEAKVREAEAKLAEVNADVQMQVEEEKNRAEMAEAKVREAEAKLALVEEEIIAEREALAAAKEEAATKLAEVETERREAERVKSENALLQEQLASAGTAAEIEAKAAEDALQKAIAAKENAELAAAEARKEAEEAEKRKAIAVTKAEEAEAKAQSGEEAWKTEAAAEKTRAEEAIAQAEEAIAKAAAVELQVTKARAEAETAKAEVDTAKAEVKASEVEIEKGRTRLGEAELQAQQARAEVEKARAEVENVRAQAIAAETQATAADAQAQQARAEIEAARAEAEATRAEVENARAKAEAEAQQTRAEAEAARAEAEAARVEVEKARAKAEAEAQQTRAEAEAARAEAEAARAEVEKATAKAEAEAEARANAEEARDAARAEIEEARAKAEAEARAKAEAEAEARAKAEAEAEADLPEESTEDSNEEKEKKLQTLRKEVERKIITLQQVLPKMDDLTKNASLEEIIRVRTNSTFISPVFDTYKEQLQNILLDPESSDLEEASLSQKNKALDILLDMVEMLNTVNIHLVLAGLPSKQGKTKQDQTEKNIRQYITKGDLNEENFLSVSLTDTEKYGPFRRIYNGYDTVRKGIGKLNLKEKLAKNDAIVFGATGFSGTGKTYTLLNTENTYSVLVQTRKYLLENDIQDVTMNAFELYAQFADPSTETERRDTHECDDADTVPETMYYYKYNPNTGAISESNTPSPFLENVNDSSKALAVLEQHRKEKMRIRYTPNNKESSRGHLFIQCTFTQENVEKTILIMDMGGSEDKGAIQNMYYYKRKIMSSSSLKQYLKELPYLMNGLEKQIIKQGSKLENLYVFENDETGLYPRSVVNKNSKQNALLTIKRFENIQEETFIRYNEWNNAVQASGNEKMREAFQAQILYDKNEAWKLFYQYVGILMNPLNTLSTGSKIENNAFLFLLEQVVKMLDGLLIDLKTRYGDIDTYSEKTNQLTISDAIAKFQDILKRLKEPFAYYQEGTNTVETVFIIQKTLMLLEYLIEPLFDKEIIPQQLYDPKSGYFDIQLKSSDKKNTVRTRANFVKDLLPILQKNLSTMTEAVKEKLTELSEKDTEPPNLIRDFYCPIRQEGNYIQRTIDRLKDILERAVQTTTEPSSEEPQNSDTRQFEAIFNNLDKPKYYLYGCVRMDWNDLLLTTETDKAATDKAATDKAAIDKAEIQNTHEVWKNGFLETLQFLHHINPFRKNASQAGGGDIPPSLPFVSPEMPLFLEDVSQRGGLVSYGGAPNPMAWSIDTFIHDDDLLVYYAKLARLVYYQWLFVERGSISQQDLLQEGLLSITLMLAYTATIPATAHASRSMLYMVYDTIVTQALLWSMLKESRSSTGRRERRIPKTRLKHVSWALVVPSHVLLRVLYTAANPRA